MASVLRSELNSTLSAQLASATSTVASAMASSSSGSSARTGGGDDPYIIFPLDRNIRISLFPTPLPDPLSAYRPRYATLPDGSLLTAVYQADLFSANSRLFGIAALLTLGAVNVWTCVSYIRRGKVKDKTLFYLLLASQLLLPAGFSALLAPFFLETVDCTIVNIVALATTAFSYSILITGILGLKAYRCLSRSRFILVVVWILQLAIFALFALDIRGINSPRRISGSCGTDGVVKFTPIALILTVFETLFLALCFLYAVWKSTLYPAVQGRLSIALSEKTPADDPRDDTVRRGWWDYVPRAPASDVGSIRSPGVGMTGGMNMANGAPNRTSDDSLVKRLRNSVMRLTTSMDIQPQPLEPQTFTRKPSIPTEYPLSQPPRPRHQPRQSEASEKERLAKTARQSTSTRARLSEVPPSARATSVKSINSQRSSRVDPLQPIRPIENDERNDRAASPSAESKQIPAVLQVRAVIREEMIYTTIIMLSCVLAAVISFWRASQNDLAFGPSVWLGANWAAISLLVMRTFSKVVQRHEREAILQSPSAYNAGQNGFGPNFASANARRRRDALAHIDSLASTQMLGPRKRRQSRRSSWDYTTNANPGHVRATSLFDDDASIRRREGLKAWDAEKERERRRMEVEEENPFADFHEIGGRVDIFDGEAGDIGRRKSGEGPFGAEEMMLDSDPIHRQVILQKPLIASPWGESPFSSFEPTSPAADSTFSGSDRGLISQRRRQSIGLQRSVSPMGASSPGSRPNSAGSVQQPSPEQRPRYLQPLGYTLASVNPSLMKAGPSQSFGTRRGAIVSPESEAPAAIVARVSPPHSLPPSHNGSSIELLEQPNINPR